MPTYLVEAYHSRSGGDPLAAAEALADEGTTTRYHLSLVLPDEDIVFHVVESPSLDLVRDVTIRADLRCQRISEALLISADDVELHREKEET
jgi:hypothetical protein